MPFGWPWDEFGLGGPPGPDIEPETAKEAAAACCAAILQLYDVLLTELVTAGEGYPVCCMMIEDGDSGLGVVVPPVTAPDPGTTGSCHDC